MSMPDPLATTPGGQPLWTSWKNERATARALGVSATYLRRAIKTLGVEGYRAPDGTLRYWPDLEDKLKAAFETAQTLTEDEDAPEPVSKVTEGSLLHEMAAALRDARAHEVRLLTIICGPVERMMGTLEAQQARQDARIETLEKGRDEAQTARETMLDKLHERTLETQVVTDQLERKKQVTAAFTGKLPAILDRLETSIVGSDPRVKSATASMIAFLKKLEPAKLQALVAADMPFLTDEEKAALGAVLDSVGIPRTPSTAPTEPTKDQ